MDGSFAFAFLLVLGMFLANLATLTFGTGLFLLKDLDRIRRVSIAAVIAMVLVALACWFGAGLVWSEYPTFPEDRSSWVDTLPENTLSITLNAVLLLGSIALVWIVVSVLRARSPGFWSFSKWLLIPASLLHVVLSVAAIYVVVTFASLGPSVHS